MKNIKIFYNWSFGIKTGLATIVLSLLGLNISQEKVPSSSSDKSKLVAFNTVSAMELLKISNTYNILESLPKKPINYNEILKVTFRNDNIFSDDDTLDAEVEIIKIVTGKKRVEYIYSDGSAEIREGGTLPWRNKNPGALRSGKRQIGTANKFAVYATEEDGIQDLKALLCSENYYNLTLQEAVFKYAPPHENNTTRYQANIKRLTGLDLNTKLCELTDEELDCVIKTIKCLEGWTPGKLTYKETVEITPADTFAMTNQYTR